jgi:hypothetical protein
MVMAMTHFELAMRLQLTQHRLLLAPRAWRGMRWVVHASGLYNPTCLLCMLGAVYFYNPARCSSSSCQVLAVFIAISNLLMSDGHLDNRPPARAPLAVMASRLLTDSLGVNLAVLEGRMPHC